MGAKSYLLTFSHLEGQYTHTHTHYWVIASNNVYSTNTDKHRYKLIHVYYNNYMHNAHSVYRIELVITWINFLNLGILAEYSLISFSALV